eukprot:NODE_6_length_70510_cov_1.054395.p7 type:complete len:639 gc:universal NODE_6_length_70510_cov_1.054395:21643-23559(+)
MTDGRGNLTRTLSTTQPSHHLNSDGDDKIPPRSTEPKPPKKKFYYQMPGSDRNVEKVPEPLPKQNHNLNSGLYLQPTIGGLENLSLSNMPQRSDSKELDQRSLNAEKGETLQAGTKLSSSSLNSDTQNMSYNSTTQQFLMTSVDSEQDEGIPPPSVYNQFQQQHDQQQYNRYSEQAIRNVNSSPNIGMVQHQSLPPQFQSSPPNTHLKANSDVGMARSPQRNHLSPAFSQDRDRRPSVDSNSGYSFDVQQIQHATSQPSNMFIAGGDNQPTNATLQMYRDQLKKANDPILLLEFSKYLIQMSEHVLNEKASQQQIQQKQKQLQSEALKYIKKVTQNKVSNLNEQQKTAVSEGLVFLAECYGSGALNVGVDHEKAFQLYHQASKLNHPQATYRVAVCNELGAGCKRDSQRSVQYFRKSAALGDVAGMYKMGLIMLNGLLGQQRNPREAISWLKRAAQVADTSNPHALHELGLIYEKEGVPNIIPDENYSRDLFTQAAFLGYAPSQYRLGYIYEYGTLGCPIDPRRSIAWYTKAAQQGHPDSELALSGWYLTGADGILQRSDTEAYLWARKAADKGLAKAEYAVGYYSEMGIGVKKDIEEARRWYVRSASQGNQRALQRLNELKKLRGMQRKDDENCIIM